jgi:hypothetical protein
VKYVLLKAEVVDADMCFTHPFEWHRFYQYEDTTTVLNFSSSEDLPDPIWDKELEKPLNCGKTMHYYDETLQHKISRDYIHEATDTISVEGI